MRNSVKGVLAAGAAFALLVGGGGTLAFWTDSELYGGAAIDSGSLSLGTVSCGDWLLDAAGGGETFTPGVDAIVPGDTLTRTCASTVTAVGKHLTADIDVTGGVTSIATELVDEGVTFTYEITKTAPLGAPEPIGATISSADDGYELTATFELAFPYGTADNDSMAKLASMTDVTITATQTHS